MGSSPWTDSARQKIVDEVFRLCVDNNIPLPFERGMLIRMVRQAQQNVLIAIEQREITNAAQYAWVEEQVMERMTAPLGMYSPAYRQMNPSLWDHMRRRVAASREVQLFIDSLTEEMFSQVQQQVNTRLEEAHLPLVNIQPVIHKPLGTKVEVPRLPRVVIVGLLPDQANVLRQSLSKYIEIIDVKDNVRKFDVCKKADLVVLATDFIGHHQDAKVRSLTDRWERVSGVITNIRDFLTRRYVPTSEKTP